MSNTAKYLGMILLTFACGAFTSLTESHPGLVDIVKHGAIFSLPTILALRTKLEDAIGIKPEDEATKSKAKGMGA